MCTTEDSSLSSIYLYTQIVYNLHAHTHKRFKRNTNIIYCIIIYLYVLVSTIERLETVISRRSSRTGVVPTYRDSMRNVCTDPPAVEHFYIMGHPFLGLFLGGHQWCLQNNLSPSTCNTTPIWSQGNRRISTLIICPTLHTLTLNWFWSVVISKLCPSAKFWLFRRFQCTYNYISFKMKNWKKTVSCKVEIYPLIVNCPHYGGRRNM